LGHVHGIWGGTTEEDRRSRPENGALASAAKRQPNSTRLDSRNHNQVKQS